MCSKLLENYPAVFSLGRLLEEIDYNSAYENKHDDKGMCQDLFFTDVEGKTSNDPSHWNSESLQLFTRRFTDNASCSEASGVRELCL